MSSRSTKRPRPPQAGRGQPLQLSENDREDLSRALDLLESAWVFRVASGVLLVPLALLFAEAFNTPWGLLFPLVWLAWSLRWVRQGRTLARSVAPELGELRTRRELQRAVAKLLVANERREKSARSSLADI